MEKLVKDNEIKLTVVDDDAVHDTFWERLKLRLKHMCVIVILLGFIIVTIKKCSRDCDDQDLFKTYGFYSAVFMYAVNIVPCLSIPTCISSFLGIVMFNPYEKARRPEVAMSTIPFICFRVVTRGDFPKLVRENVEINKMICERVGLQKFMIEVVSDNPINLPENEEFVREIIVPASYRTVKNTLYKARALNYCLEDHVSMCAHNDWIVHLDEETLLSEQAVYGIVNFISSGTADIGQGPITYANGEVIQNWVTTLADSIRLAFDYSLFRFSFGFLHVPPFGFKGSYVVVRHGVETAIGLDFGPHGSIAEDCYFALTAWSRGYKFDFILGEMKEKSPFTIVDFMTQRKRWFVGQSYAFLSRDIPFYNKAILGLTLTASAMMPFIFISIQLSLTDTLCKSLFLNGITGFCGGTFAFLLFFGAFLSLSRRNWPFWKAGIVSALNCMFLGVITANLEFAAVVWGIFSVMFKVTEFTIVKKEATTEKGKWCCYRAPFYVPLSFRRILKFVKKVTFKFIPFR